MVRIPRAIIRAKVISLGKTGTGVELDNIIGKIITGKSPRILAQLTGFMRVASLHLSMVKVESIIPNPFIAT